MARKKIKRRQAIATLQDFICEDYAFLQKISAALQKVHEYHGYKSVRDCLSIDEKTGDAEVDLDILIEMLIRSESKLNNECCGMACSSMISSKTVLGSLFTLVANMVLCWSVLPEDTSNKLKHFDSKTIGMIVSQILLAIGALFLMHDALSPYFADKAEIKRIRREVQKLKEYARMGKKMGDRRMSSNMIKIKANKLDEDTPLLLTPTKEEMIKEDGIKMESQLSLENVYDTVMIKKPIKIMKQKAKKQRRETKAAIDAFVQIF